MNLQAKYKDKIVGIICTMMPNVNIYLINYNPEEYCSNINILLRGESKICTNAFKELKKILKVIDSPYTIDLIDYHSLDEKHRKKVFDNAKLLKRAIKVVTREKIEEVAKRLVDVYKPLEIYMFGSYVWGNPTKASDLDFLIIIPKSDEKSYKRSIKGYRALRDIDVSVDFLVYTKREFDELSSHISSLCRKVKNEGESVYVVA